MNQIHIWAPRWRDRTVLIADRKLEAHNEIVIEYKDSNGKQLWERPLYISGADAKTYPLEQMATKAGGMIGVRAIPISKLEEEQIDA